ncbi:MAG: hypothetical protein Q9169_007832, partial [Polycauliona sp. 2 TL-2023]
MRYRAVGFVALLSLGLQAESASVHIDVSSNGDVELDMDLKPKLHLPSGRGQYKQSPPLSNGAARAAEDFVINLGYEVHAGKLS